jgi:hypothetical protein
MIVTLLEKAVGLVHEAAQMVLTWLYSPKHGYPDTHSGSMTFET